MQDKETAEPARNQVGLRIGGVIPGSADEGPGVPVGGKPAEQTQTADDFAADPDKDYGAVSRVARRLYPDAWKVHSAAPYGDGYARRCALRDAAKAINVVLEEMYGQR